MAGRVGVVFCVESVEVEVGLKVALFDIEHLQVTFAKDGHILLQLHLLVLCIDVKVFREGAAEQSLKLKGCRVVNEVVFKQSDLDTELGQERVLVSHSCLLNQVLNIDQIVGVMRILTLRHVFVVL